MSFIFAVFVGVLAVVLGPYWLIIVRPEQLAERAVRGRLKGKRAPLLVRGFVKTRERLSSVRMLDTLLGGQAQVTAPLTRMIARSGLSTTLGTLLMTSVFLGVLATFTAETLWHRVLVSLVAGAVASLIPFLYVRHAATKRLASFEEQFPDAIDLVARALRAGHALPAALQMTADEIADPVGAEFRVLFDQQNFGMSLPDALRAFGERLPLIDARFFVTAILTQREMGGDLSEVLDKLAAVIRERFKVKRHVRAASAHGRITGLVLGCLPPAVAGLLTLIAPEHIRLLVDDPIGIDMIAVALTLQITGVLIIRRIVDVEY